MNEAADWIWVIVEIRKHQRPAIARLQMPEQLQFRRNQAAKHF